MNQTLNELLFCRISLLEATVKVFLQLLKLLLNLKNTPKNYLNGLIPALSLFLHAIHTWKLKKKSRHASHTFNQEIKNVRDQLQKWITDQFLGPFQLQSQHIPWRPQLEEMKVYKHGDNTI